MRISDWSSDVCPSDLWGRSHWWWRAHSKVAEWPNPLHRFLQCVTRAETGGLRSRAVDYRCDLYSSFSAHAGYSQAPPIADAFRRSVHPSLRDQVSCRAADRTGPSWLDACIPDLPARYRL